MLDNLVRSLNNAARNMPLDAVEQALDVRVPANEQLFEHPAFTCRVVEVPDFGILGLFGYIVRDYRGDRPDLNPICAYYEEVDGKERFVEFRRTDGKAVLPSDAELYTFADRCIFDALSALAVIDYNAFGLLSNNIYVESFLHVMRGHSYPTTETDCEDMLCYKFLTNAAIALHRDRVLV